MDDTDMGGDADDQSAPETEGNQAMNTGDEPMEGEGETKPPAKEQKRKFVATIHEVNEAFDSVSTLRYSQPTHLQGAFPLPPAMTNNSAMAQESVRVSPLPPSTPATLLVARFGKSALHPLEPLSMP